MASENPAAPDASAAFRPDEIDVLIVGAGLSGIDAAARLTQTCPDRSFRIFEARDAIGGTWDLFRYPGIRSDSDMHTLGFPFRPWTGEKAIADGPDIRTYIEETAEATGVKAAIRFRHRVTAAAWSSADARWTVSYDGDGVGGSLRCRYLYMASGYYDYDSGYSPDIAAAAGFRGQWVHPQHWPEALDCAGKRIAVIGSGATAVTLVPALTARGAHVTMIQRSPSYIVARPSRDKHAQALQKWLPRRIAAAAVRWKNVGYGILTYRLARRHPDRMRGLIMRGVKACLPGFPDIERHFTPRYDPWDQRLCLVPDADLFRSLRDGSARIVTDTIERATPDGLMLGSGTEILADIIVTATGLRLKLFGGVAITVDGVAIDPSRQVIYRGMMLSGVPNFVMAFGYTNASWTLKIDLVARRFCRMLGYMQRHGFAIARPDAPRPGIEPEPMLDFNSGYVRRADTILPRQGSARPWRVRQNYFLDMLAFRFGRLSDGVLIFAKAPGGAGR